MATEIKASVTMKRRFHKAKKEKGNENLSLKAYVRSLISMGDQLAQAWFDHKSPHFNDEARALRLKNKGGRIAMEKNATKMSRRKKAAGKGSSTAATTK